MFRSLRARAKRLKRDLLALYLASRDPRVPWYAKLIPMLTVAYTLSPIDLIPDFIPVLGYLDDVILVPLGIALSLRMLPPEVLSECRARAEEMSSRPGRKNYLVAAVIVLLWAAVVVLAALWLAPML
jgi:uncharacterized membrane protein YkvA (DUF1232 family)